MGRTDGRGGYDVEELRRRHPLADVVAATGARFWRGTSRAIKCNCPFPWHRDSTPSFYVYLDQGRWWCFGGGCSRGGDVIDFVRLRDGLPDFPAACERLAGALPPPRRPEVPDPYPGDPPGDPDASPNGRAHPGWEELDERGAALLDRIAAHYAARLAATPALRRYVCERVGGALWVLNECRVGFADGETLAAALRPRERALAVELGLLVETPATAARPAGLREFLAGRIVVPELREGHAIWFIGRRRPDLDRLPGIDARVPKYKALPGPRPILGLEPARGLAENHLVEGVFDYLVGRRWGLPVWSPCGTALQPARLGFLVDTARVFGAFDGDAGGRAGAERFGALLGPRFYPLALPEGSDVADLGRLPDGLARYEALVATAREQGEARNARLAAELMRRAAAGGPGRGGLAVGAALPPAAPPNREGYADWAALRHGAGDGPRGRGEA